MILLSHDYVHCVIMLFISILTTSLDKFTNISISQDRTILERHSIQEKYYGLYTRQDQDETYITIRYTDRIFHTIKLTVCTLTFKKIVKEISSCHSIYSRIKHATTSILYIHVYNVNICLA